jgi:hypothetical protein
MTNSGGDGRVLGEAGGKVVHAAVNLDAIREQGQGALNSGDGPGSADARLNELEISEVGQYHTVTILRSDDIFRSWTASRSGHPAIPAQGTLTRAVVHLRFRDTPKAATVEIRLPDSVEIEPANASEKCYQWFCKSPLAATGRLAHLLLVLGLAASTALAAGLDGLDDDDDDGESVEAKGERPRAERAVQSLVLHSQLTGDWVSPHVSSIEIVFGRPDGPRRLVPIPISADERR